MDDKSGEPVNKTRPWRGFAITVVIIAIAVAVMIFNSPRGFEVDLTKIGSGQPTLVMVYDPNLVISSEQIYEMNQMRDEFEAELQFLLADIGYPEAREFMEQYKARPAMLLIFAADGSHLKTLHAPLSAEQLSSEIRATLDW